MQHTPHQVAVLESEHGRIELARNRAGLGYRLTDDAEGFGAGLVENELTPRLGRRGSMLGTQREAAGTMMVPIVISGRSRADVSEKVAKLRRVLKLADGTSRLSLIDQTTGAGRYREIAYKNGLDTPAWSSPYTVKYVLDVDYMDPWAYSVDDDHTRLVVAPGAFGGLQFPLRFPLQFGAQGGTNHRYAINNGDKPAPVRLVFNGPLRDPVVNVVGGWRFALSGELNWDESLTVDARDYTVEVRSSTGGRPRSVYTWIRSGSRLSDLHLEPGHNTLEFRATDPTGTASVDVYWPHTYQAMQ